MRPLIEAVTVCVHYDDFLEAVIPFNLPLFDRWLIVTTPEDRMTRWLCKKHSLRCLVTEIGGQNEGEFRKGKMIEKGLQHLSEHGWRIHIDADIALPLHFRQTFEWRKIDEDKIYGIDRVMVRSWEQWQYLLQTGYLNTQHTDSHRTRFPDGIPVGDRWVGNESEGYVPIGFFQMWHSSQDQWEGIRSKPYPSDHNNACRTDVQHGLQWDRSDRLLIPEIIAVHLDSEECPNGTNWNGRKTKRFGPSIESDQNQIIKPVSFVDRDQVRESCPPEIIDKPESLVLPLK